MCARVHAYVSLCRVYIHMCKSGSISVCLSLCFARSLSLSKKVVYSRLSHLLFSLSLSTAKCDQTAAESKNRTVPKQNNNKMEMYVSQTPNEYNNTVLEIIGTIFWNFHIIIQREPISD